METIADCTEPIAARTPSLHRAGPDSGLSHASIASRLTFARPAWRPCSMFTQARVAFRRRLQFGRFAVEFAAVRFKSGAYVKTVILAGGLGSRLSEETSLRPKPMTEIGGRPLLWHIMKIYSHYGMNDFIICLGYKGYVIKEYFSNYFLHMSDVTVDLKKNSVEIHQSYSEPWRITLVDTGATTMTGGRLKAIRPYLDEDEPFCFTYGDGVADIDIGALIAFHRRHGKTATITAVAPPGRFGALEFDGDLVTDFREKPAGDGGRINGGFFVASTKVLDYIDGSNTIWEKEPLEKLARSGELVAFHHDGFWQSVDTLRDKTLLEDMWAAGNAPWKVWG